MLLFSLSEAIAWLKSMNFSKPTLKKVLLQFVALTQFLSLSEVKKQSLNKPNYFFHFAIKLRNPSPSTKLMGSMSFAIIFEMRAVVFS